VKRPPRKRAPKARDLAFDLDAMTRSMRWELDRVMVALNGIMLDRYAFDEVLEQRQRVSLIQRVAGGTITPDAQAVCDLADAIYWIADAACKLVTRTGTAELERLRAADAGVFKAWRKRTDDERSDRVMGRARAALNAGGSPQPG
jgi:sulfur carrier protein ThiS